MPRAADVAYLTSADATPACLLRIRCTLIAHDAQVIPSTAKSRCAGEVVACITESAIRRDRVTLVLDRGNQCVLTDQGVIEVHAYAFAGYVDDHRAYTVEWAERALDGGLAGRARDFGYRNDRCAHDYLQPWPRPYARQRTLTQCYPSSALEGQGESHADRRAGETHQYQHEDHPLLRGLGAATAACT